MNGPVRMLRVAREYARIGWVRKSQFRWEFVNQVVMDCLFYLSFTLTFRILYGLEEGVTLAGWTYAEMRVFVGMVFLYDAFRMTWLGQSWHFGEDLKAGKLDPLRLRPGQPVFLYFFQRFSPEGLTNFAIASAWMAYALVAGGYGAAAWLLLPWALVVAAWSQTMLTVLFSTFEFWLVNSDMARFLEGVFGQAADRPADVYPARMRGFLLYVLPVGGLAWFPAALVTGKVGLGFGVAYTAGLALFGLAVVRLFRYGFRRYESALG